METEDIEKYILKMDKEPNLYFIKLAAPIKKEVMENINAGFKAAMDIHCPGSHIVMLTELFSPIIMPSEEVMKELGWAKIIKEKEEVNEVETED